MPLKLGEILIAGQHLSPADLKKALDAQLVFGGRLGTNLIDLGLLDEETLTRVLHEQKRVEVATPRMLEAADPKALRLVPAKLADRHKALAFAVADHVLKVAMIDPTDLIAIDEIAFASGCRVVAFIAPEIRILGYLERHYDIRRPVRYVRLSADDSPSSRAARSAPSRGSSQAEERRLPAIVPALSSIDELLGPGEPPAPAPPAAVVEIAEEGDLEEVARRLAEADTREEIGDALMLIARQEFTRVLVWLIQRDTALGWLAHAPGLAPSAARGWARQARVSLKEPSVLADVVASRRYYLGELPSRPADDALATLFGERAHDAVLIPVTLGEQVLIVLQGDAGGKPLTSFDLKAVRAACQKASTAMEILLMRSRIRQV